MSKNGSNFLSQEPELDPRLILMLRLVIGTVNRTITERVNVEITWTEQDYPKLNTLLVSQENLLQIQLIVETCRMP